MGQDLVRFALDSLPAPKPDDPYEAERPGDSESWPLSDSERAFVLALQRWCMAVRWRARGQGLPFEEWKRAYKPWLRALVGNEAVSPEGRAAGFAGWLVMCDFMNACEEGRDPRAADA